MKSTIAHYNVLERLGDGALGDVFRARDTRAGRTVAIMVPPAELAASPTRRARFLEAARRAATLNHPNIAMLFDVVEDADGCYLVYEFAAGPSLREEMGGAALPVHQALHLAAQVADALEEGHANGFVHGDLRPDTIVVTPKGSAKVLKFGMTSWTAGGMARAKAAASPDALAGDEIQVAAYLSPEQALGGPADPRSDLFTFGAVLYEMLTGRDPFTGSTAGATIGNVLEHTPAPPSSVRKDLPPALDAVVATLLAKRLDARCQTAAAAAADIRRVAAGLDGWTDGDTAPSRIPGTVPAAGIWLTLLALAAIAGAMWWYLRW